MKSFLVTSSIFLSCVLIVFFVVFAFHAQTPLQEEVKQYLDSGKGQLPFSEDANNHMQDVFWLMFAAKILAVCSILILCLNITHISQKQIRIVSGLLIGIPVLLALIPWNTTFTVFHQVFFPQGNWMFAGNSLLIQTYPAEFFVQYAIFFGGLLVVSGITLFLISKQYTETNVW